jgi:hypothetical protein
MTSRTLAMELASPGSHQASELLVGRAPGSRSTRRLSFGVESNRVAYVSVALKRLVPRPKSPRQTRAGERDLTADQVDFYRQLLWEQASAGDQFDTRRSDAPGVIGPTVREAIAYMQEQLNVPDGKGTVVRSTCGGLAVDGVLSPATRQMLECWRETSRQRIAHMLG